MSPLVVGVRLQDSSICQLCTSNQSHTQPWLWEVGQVVLQRGERGTSRKLKGEKAPVGGLVDLTSFMSRKLSCPSREPSLVLELH